MRSYRPSGRAAVIVGALALTLVVAGTSGAVAAKLITSKNIKDGTIRSVDLHDGSVTNDKIAPGAVDWDKSLSDATKAQIESLLGAGLPGPEGPRGATGPVGPMGNQGPAGPAGNAADLVVYDVFVPGSEASESGTRELVSATDNGQIQLTEPGSYLVTVQGAFSSPPDGAAISLGSYSESEVAFLNSCFADSTVQTGLPLAVCSTTYTLGVSEGSPLTLPVYASTFNCSEASCWAPGFAKVAIYKMTDEVATDSTTCRSVRRLVHARC
jgi:hypothetical protein